MAISLPRTWICTPSKDCSTTRSSSSRWPSRLAMRWLPGTEILTWVLATTPRMRGPDQVSGRGRFALMAEPLGGDLEKRLTEWLREARVDEDAQRRSRERWLRQQAEEDA